jgi:RNA polymerase sigma-70 factor (ECF subfamily)
MNEDQELIERFKNGDEFAFDQLVRKYTSRAYGIAYGILGSREDAQEVAQDAFIRIHRALPKFRGDSEFTTWMYRIVTNLAKNKYRWNKCRGSKVTSSLNAPIEGTEGDDAVPDFTRGAWNKIKGFSYAFAK